MKELSQTHLSHLQLLSNLREVSQAEVLEAIDQLMKRPVRVEERANLWMARTYYTGTSIKDIATALNRKPSAISALIRRVDKDIIDYLILKDKDLAALELFMSLPASIWHTVLRMSVHSFEELHGWCAQEKGRTSKSPFEKQRLIGGKRGQQLCAICREHLKRQGLKCTYYDNFLV